ncbi:TPA: hypothetical protein U2K93_001644 [Enterococcus faecalis]|nr:hypothetical protein [Enterococcus faecalis]HEM7729861.1 hypothetical protein [Enterococcus faecalis]
MDNSSEKNIYEQMKLIIEERRELTRQYYKLKNHLNLFDHLNFKINSFNSNLFGEEKEQTF